VAADYAPAVASRTRLAVDGRVLDDRYHGIGRITAALLSELAHDPVLDVVVFVRNDQRSERFDLDLLIAGSGFERAVFDLPLTSPAQAVRWPGALRRYGIDVVLFPYHMGAAVTGRSRRYAIVHDCILEARPAFSPDRRTRSLYLLLTRVVVRRTRVLTPSLSSAADVRRHYGTEIPDCQVIPWGVDPAFGSDDLGPGDAASPVLPDLYHLHVGVRRPHKNVVTLIRALAVMPGSEHLVLTGSADRRFPDPVPEAIRTHGLQDRVHELTDLSETDLVRVYRGARTLLYPSLIEGFGLPLLEAMAAGVPVVASDIPVFREVVGNAAWFVPATAPAAWARAVRDLQDDAVRDDLIARGHRRAAAATWSAAADRLRALL
jgi:glycosyltransferase involved in cell wall biosynthesis